MSAENKQFTPAKLRDMAWDEQAGDWVYEAGKRDRIPAPNFEEFYQKHKGKFRNALDVGCGTGRFLIPMVQDGLEVTGVEPSHKRKVAAEVNLERAGLKGKSAIIEGDSRNLSFVRDKSIDWVFTKGAIHHNTWTGIQESFREIARVLRPGGFFLFQGRSTNDSALERSEEVPDTGKTAKELTGWKKGVVQHYFKEDELWQLATENGFEIVLGPEERVRAKGNTQNARWWVVYKKI